MENAVPKMMTIRQVASTGILTEYCLRQLVKQKKIPCLFSGNKALINYDKLVASLNNLKM